jgi:hypothetical protein
LLGIPSDKSSSIVYDTSNCFRMVDGHEINMGGYNTDNEAYFGFRLESYCSGT